MILKRLALVCVLAVLASAVSGCEKEQSMPTVVSMVESSAFPITINGITFENAPQKIVSLSPFITDVIYDIGAEGLLVGVCDYCEVEGKTLTGSAISPDVDCILESGAELVLTTTPLSSNVQSALESDGIKVLTLKTPVSLQTLENLYASMIAILSGNADYAAQAQELLAIVYQSTSEIQKSDKSVLCVVSPYFNAAGTNTLCNDVLSLVANNAIEEEGYADITQSDISCDIVFADNSLKNTDISEFVGNAEIIYTDFTPLENPNIENIASLITFMCENI